MRVTKQKFENKKYLQSVILIGEKRGNLSLRDYKDFINYRYSFILYI